MSPFDFENLLDEAIGGSASARTQLLKAFSSTKEEFWGALRGQILAREAGRAEGEGPLSRRVCAAAEAIDEMLHRWPWRWLVRGAAREELCRAVDDRMAGEALERNRRSREEKKP